MWRAQAAQAIGTECRRFRDASRQAVNCDDDAHELSALSPQREIEHARGFRQFLLRGPDKVAAE